MKLLHDIRSSFNPAHCYGRAGDEVKVIHDHGDVLLLEGQDGQKFPINRSALDYLRPAAVPVADKPPAKQRWAPAKEKPEAIQQDLF